MNFNFKTLFSTITFLIIGSYVVQGQNAYGKYYTNRSATDFLSDSRLIMTVNPDSFDIDLINAALFHLSNLERIKKGEKPLDHFLDLEKSSTKCVVLYDAFLLSYNNLNITHDVFKR